MNFLGLGRESFPLILTLARRELKDALRDWRIVTPIAILTIFFPWLMDIAAQLARDFVARYGAYIIAERMYPFLLMVVGFFPITFSLVIALESFVGEKERQSLEPLLASPLSDVELYLGKFLASLLLPLIASFCEIAIYVIGLFLSTGYSPPPLLLLQVVILTFCEALVMVAGAVVISSTATSVRAANLLASFIIVPMALVVQGVSIIMFWAHYSVLWYVVAALVMVAVLLMRMGLALFNREHLLTRQVERFNLSGPLKRLYELFVHRPGVEGKPFSLSRVYRYDLMLIFRDIKLALLLTCLIAIGGLLLGVIYAFRYPLPPQFLRYFNPDTKLERMRELNLGILPPLQTRAIFLHNFRSLTLSSLLSLITLGLMPAMVIILNLGMVGFFLGEVAIMGQNPWIFLMAFILPHGIFEVPAAVITAATALRIGAIPVSPEAGRDLRDRLLLSLADWLKVLLFVALPLLLIAAFIEANLTPLVAGWFYG